VGKEIIYLRSNFILTEREIHLVDCVLLNNTCGILEMPPLYMSCQKWKFLSRQQQQQ